MIYWSILCTSHFFVSLIFTFSCLWWKQMGQNCILPLLRKRVPETPKSQPSFLSHALKDIRKSNLNFFPYLVFQFLSILLYSAFVLYKENPFIQIYLWKCTEDRNSSNNQSLHLPQPQIYYLYRKSSTGTAFSKNSFNLGSFSYIHWEWLLFWHYDMG